MWRDHRPIHQVNMITPRHIGKWREQDGSAVSFVGKEEAGKGEEIKIV